jgi:TetR/AcrR family transcriptional repressor of lmrAB and yxaGH operons
MPAAKIDERELLARLVDVFCSYGFEGASLSRISKATGLQRASLYHRYPGGKEEMALAVLAETDRQFAEGVLEPLVGKAQPATRVKRMADRLAAHYDGGQRSCLLDALSLGDATEAMRDHVRGSFGAWRDAMAALAREAGATPALARRRAEEALTRIQGGLVLARGTGDGKPFARALAGLPGLLAGEGGG